MPAIIVCAAVEGMQAEIRTRKLLALVNSLDLRVFLAAVEAASTWAVEDACHCQRTRHLP